MMKALMGKLAKVIRADVKGNRALKAFVADGSTENTVITLSNGKRYRISSSPL